MPTTIRHRVRARLRTRSTILKRRADGSLAARIAAPPSDGHANRALIDSLAKSLDLPRRAITIERGRRAGDKQIAVISDNPSAGQAAGTRLQAAG